MTTDLEPGAPLSRECPSCATLQARAKKLERQVDELEHICEFCDRENNREHKGEEEHFHSWVCAVCHSREVSKACDRADAAEAQKAGLREALIAVGLALKGASGHVIGGGSYWEARRFVEARGGYTGDLDGVSVLHEVARVALASTAEPTAEKEPAPENSQREEAPKPTAEKSAERSPEESPPVIKVSEKVFDMIADLAANAPSPNEALRRAMAAGRKEGQQLQCRCGSGAHPRRCDVHPEQYEEDVRKLNDEAKGAPAQQPQPEEGVGLCAHGVETACLACTCSLRIIEPAPAQQPETPQGPYLTDTVRHLIEGKERLERTVHTDHGRILDVSHALLDVLGEQGRNEALRKHGSVLETAAHVLRSLSAELRATRGAMVNAWQSIQSGEKQTGLAYIQAKFNYGLPPKDYLRDANQEMCRERNEARAERDALREKAEKLEREIGAVLDKLPGTIRVREGGGPEALAASLAVSASRLANEHAALREKLSRARRALQRIKDMMPPTGMDPGPFTHANMAAVAQDALSETPSAAGGE